MEDKKLPKVCIIILNYNGWRDTITCLETVFNIDYENFDVILVDNGSTDNSLQMLENWTKQKEQYSNSFPDHSYFQSLHSIDSPISYAEYERWENEEKHKEGNQLYEELFILTKLSANNINTELIFIDTQQNLGYAGGNNVGIRFCLTFLNPDYILILNNDTVVPANLIDKLVEVFTFHENAGLCGPVEYSFREPYSIQSAGGRFNLYTGRNKLFKNPPQKIEAVDWVVGSCMMIKKDLFFKTGFFDERFFLYVEEADYAYRVKESGYEIFVTPETCIWHKGGTKGGKTFDEAYYFYVMRNRLLFALKHLRFYQFVFFMVNHFKKLFTFSLRDLIVNNRANFFKRLCLIKDAFVVYKKEIKNYHCVKK